MNTASAGTSAPTVYPPTVDALPADVAYKALSTTPLSLEEYLLILAFTYSVLATSLESSLVRSVSLLSTDDKPTENKEPTVRRFVFICDLASAIHFINLPYEIFTLSPLFTVGNSSSLPVMGDTIDSATFKHELAVSTTPSSSASKPLILDLAHSAIVVFEATFCSKVFSFFAVITSPVTHV